jgi:hypothetical protein
VTALAAPPLSLHPTRSTIAIECQGWDRWLPILTPTLREQVTVRVATQVLEGGEIVLETSLNLLVNTLNTAQDVDWHPPRRDQLLRWNSAITDTVHSRLPQVCDNGRWINDNTLQCRPRP